MKAYEQYTRCIPVQSIANQGPCCSKAPHYVGICIRLSSIAVVVDFIVANLGLWKLVSHTFSVGYAAFSADTEAGSTLGLTAGGFTGDTGSHLLAKQIDHAGAKLAVTATESCSLMATSGFTRKSFSWAAASFQRCTGTIFRETGRAWLTEQGALVTGEGNATRSVDRAELDLRGEAAVEDHHCIFRVDLSDHIRFLDGAAVENVARIV